MKDLGYTPTKEDREKMAASVPQSSSGEDQVQYPSLRFNGEQAAKAGLEKCTYGEEYELTIRVKATRIDGSSSYPGSGDSKDKPEVQFDVLACDEPREIESAGEDAAESEEEPPERKPKQKVLSPKEAGFSDDGKD